MIDDASYKLARDVHVAADIWWDGDGSASRPFKAPHGDLDHVFAKGLGESVRLTLKPGIYSTFGFYAPERFILDGGNRDTRLILKPNTTTQNPWWKDRQLRIIRHRSWSHVLIVRNITLDGNYSNQDWSNNLDNFKVEPLAANVTVAKAENVRVAGFGASGKGYRDGLEAFPLSFNTFVNGDRQNYFPSYRAIQEETSRVEILNCEVAGGQFTHGGYCTAICVRTSFGPTQGDRQPFGIRTSQAALIRDNSVSVPDGIAYGVISSEQVLFEHNQCSRTKAAVNIDVGEIVGIAFRKNRFLDCNQGFRILPHPNSRDLEITDNVLTITQPYFNKTLKEFEPWYDFWIDERNIANRKIERNHVYTVGAKPLTLASR